MGHKNITEAEFDRIGKSVRTIGEAKKWFISYLVENNICSKERAKDSADEMPYDFETEIEELKLDIEDEKDNLREAKCDLSEAKKALKKCKTNEEKEVAELDIKDAEDNIDEIENKIKAIKSDIAVLKADKKHLFISFTKMIHFIHRKKRIT